MVRWAGVAGKAAGPPRRWPGMNFETAFMANLLSNRARRTPGAMTRFYARRADLPLNRAVGFRSGFSHLR